MTDMLVKLYDLPDHRSLLDKLTGEGIHIKRALALDKTSILDFIRETFPDRPAWQDECEAALFRRPSSCWIAVKNQKVIGFSAYDATALGFFGPMGVSSVYRGLGVGKALLIDSLRSMREDGYGYAIIGWAGPDQFYRDTVGAIPIPDSFPGVYSRMVKYEAD